VDDKVRKLTVCATSTRSTENRYKRDVLPLSTERFAVMAEPIVDHIRELRQQVEEYVGITAATQAWQMRGEPPSEVWSTQ
jgi:hypothetical protein